ncbi:lysine--tRNA ligase [Pelagibacterium sp. 26DY04]|uniref:lysine--tRNA ligase n=1 Tax=Pelagibacterium sp. 26DY04 TaxID=2967130 RepID=UPI00281607F6|nr:lysine--tRNA ligase [Pelagibacterium sp. 26DY04]WMT87703.1 lysine--tRNA ligase [Pelagibacterium sp. 26DY04]
MSHTLPPLDPDAIVAATKARAWPFEEARKVVKRAEKLGKDEVIFETGYGPSGLPHIGTFGEVMRTTMVRTAFRLLTGDSIKTRLICFSDDMDGMRKIPDNVPSKEALEPFLQKPLTAVPDPWTNEFASFGDHNNAMLRRFLDTFGFDYEFASATDYYKSGKFDDMLLRTLERYDDIMGVMLPTLGAERQATYSPILPISPISGRVLYVPMKEVNAQDGTVTFEDEDGRDVTIPVTGGNVKLQWKPDFGMRWAALGVDFEMFGKDHQTNQVVYDRICAILGGTPPEHYVYELFLDEEGQKISKSKGNGITIDEWLTYASSESLALFMFQKPRTAKRLYFDVIPKAVDEYFSFAASAQKQDAAALLENPAFHIHSGRPPAYDMPVSFALLLNLATASNPENREVMWGFISAYAPGVTPQTHPHLDALVGYAIRYFHDFVKKNYRAPDDVERTALQSLSAKLATLPEGSDGETIQNAALDVAREIERYQDHSRTGPHGGPGVSGAFFQMIYQVLIGQERGPRFGSFAALYGVENTRALIERALRGELTGIESPV